MIDLKIKQISSLEKIRNEDDVDKSTQLEQITAFRGEHCAYQIALSSEIKYKLKVETETALSECVSIYAVENAVLDNPLYGYSADDDYITTEKCSMPDILNPLNDKKDIILCTGVEIIDKIPSNNVYNYYNPNKIRYDEDEEEIIVNKRR